jgi:hypothetical protein
MLLSKEVMVRCRPSNKKHFELLGYIWEYNKIISVKIEHLNKTCLSPVDLMCDYCLEEGIETVFQKPYYLYNKSISNAIILKDACKKHVYKKICESNLKVFGVENSFQREDCKLKSQQTCLEKYGVDNYSKIDGFGDILKEIFTDKYGVYSPMLLEEFREKQRETFRDRFGVDYFSQTEEWSQKTKETNLEKFGYEYALQNPECFEKFKQTSLERFGVEFPSQCEQIQEKMVDSYLKKYGVTNPTLDPDILAKQRKTLYENGNVPTSNQQKYLNYLLKGELNYPVGNCNLDISFIEEKIYIEADFGGHNLEVLHEQISQEEFDKKHMRRSYFLIRQGWREIRIISIKDRLPSDHIIFNMIDYAKQYLDSGHHWIHFNIDTGKVITSQFEKDYDFGKLRKITKKDLERFEKMEEVVAAT